MGELCVSEDTAKAGPRLGSCPACGHGCSSEARVCPGCGQPLRVGAWTLLKQAIERNIRGRWGAFWLAVLFASFGLLVLLMSKLAVDAEWRQVTEAMRRQSEALTQLRDKQRRGF